MKSIRLSLLLCFLILLGLGLGAVSFLTYQNTQQVLQAKEDIQRTFLIAVYDKNCAEEQHKLDDALLNQARALAMYTRPKFEWGGQMRSRLAVAPLLTVLSSNLDVRGALIAPLWVIPDKGGPNPYLESFRRLPFVEIQFHAEDLPRYADGRVNQYFQINTEGGTTWRFQLLSEQPSVPALMTGSIAPGASAWGLCFASVGSALITGSTNHPLPFDYDLFKAMPLHEHHYEDLELEPGLKVRRLVFKTPVAGVRIVFGQPFPRMTPPPSSRPTEPKSTGPNRNRRWPDSPPPSQERPTLAILIQCAAETTQRDVALAGLKTDLDSDLARLREDSKAALAGLRNRLLLIAIGTFAATLLGGFWLVRLGLSPLQRLSEAVSRVSVKDFRLPLEETRMPSELRPIVERLTQTLDLLKRAFAREKQAAADISHELRTPLAALLTTIEVGLRKPRKAEDYRELLSDCHVTGKQMTQLVERLLILARLDAGADTLRPRLVDVAELTEQCTTMVRPLAEARGLSLKLHRNGSAEFKTDPDKFREVVTNLLHNAIEYNRPDGSVEVELAEQQGQVQLEVRDTGIGIAPAAREQIFERFFRADPSRQADGLHAGLGLAIVKGYVDLMGGQIRVDSTEGQGSVFRLQFPVQQDERVKAVNGR
jgi:heavy metal sensor kinase